MKKIILTLCIIISSQIHTKAQNAEIKLNIASAAITAFNPSLEVGLKKNSAITFDYVGIFADEDFLNTGSPLLFSMGTFGYRKYLGSKSYQGLFWGGDIGLDVFKMNKNIIPLVANDKGSGYDVGHGYLIGVTLGYKYKITTRLNIEASISGGWHYAIHEGYNSSGVKSVDPNPTAEWTAYKAGIYLNYNLW